VILGPPASDSDLEGVEAEMSRRLPDDARQLYRWHDGCLVWIAPALGFANVGQALATYQLIRDYGLLPELSNDTQTVKSDQLFPIFNIDKVHLCVSVTERARNAVSPVYLLDVEMDQLTHVARSVGDFLDHLLRELDNGNNMVAKQYDVNWAHDPFRFDSHMIPFGNDQRA
jgi:cell wall assembly regulator SMI1